MCLDVLLIFDYHKNSEEFYQTRDSEPFMRHVQQKERHLNLCVGLLAEHESALEQDLIS